MGSYKFADRVFEIKNKYPYFAEFAREYASYEDTAAYSVEVSEDEILAENIDDAKGAALPYLETLAIYRKIAHLLASESCMLMHAAVIEYEGKAYAFTAKSGTGKTTHISLWEKVYGDKVTIVNGDKPLIRRREKDGKTEFIAYGTPWSGKEGKNTNTGAPLAGICILERSPENYIRSAGDEAVPFLIGQLLIKEDAGYFSMLLDFLDTLVRSVPIYHLGVNMEDGAAITARDGLLKKTYNEEKSV